MAGRVLHRLARVHDDRGGGPASKKRFTVASFTSIGWSSSGTTGRASAGAGAVAVFSTAGFTGVVFVPPAGPAPSWPSPWSGRWSSPASPPAFVTARAVSGGVRGAVPPAHAVPTSPSPATARGRGAGTRLEAGCRSSRLGIRSCCLTHGNPRGGRLASPSPLKASPSPMPAITIKRRGPQRRGRPFPIRLSISSRLLVSSGRRGARRRAGRAAGGLPHRPTAADQVFIRCTINAFCACSRFSAWSKMAEFGVRETA